MKFCEHGQPERGEMSIFVILVLALTNIFAMYSVLTANNEKFYKEIIKYVVIMLLVIPLDFMLIYLLSNVI